MGPRRKDSPHAQGSVRCTNDRRRLDGGLAHRDACCSRGWLNATGLREHAHPYLEELRQRTSYTTSLAVLDGPEIVYVDRVRSLRRDQGAVDLNLHPGSRLPAYCTAMGKAMLAWLPQTEVHDLIDQITFERLTPKTIASREELMQALERVRRRGYSIDDEEAELGARCIGAPIFDQEHNPVAALSVSCASARIQPHQVPALAEHLRRTCSKSLARWIK